MFHWSAGIVGLPAHGAVRIKEDRDNSLRGKTLEDAISVASDSDVDESDLHAKSEDAHVSPVLFTGIY